jgi:signal recognition particle receptor subunit beta
MVTKDDKFTQTPVLVFANKQDLAGAMSVSEITEKLLSTTFRETNRHWIVQPCVAKKGVGVFEGMSWLAETLKTIQTSS